MGCFNIMGFHSHLPLTDGADSVLFLGVHPRYKNKEVRRGFRPFAPGFEFIPIALPIFGKYDDYGRIYDIEEDANVKAIEDFFNMEIENIVEMVDDSMVGRHFHNDEYQKKYDDMCQKIHDLQGNFLMTEYELEYDLVFLLDHRFVYDTIKELGVSCYDFDRCIKETLNFCSPWEPVYETYRVFDEKTESREDMKKKFENGEISEYDYELWKARHELLLFDGSHRWFSYLNRGAWYGQKGSRVTDVSLKSSHGFWYSTYEFGDSSIMCVYEDKEKCKDLFSNLVDKYIDFLKFIAEFKAQQWCFNFHVYGSQVTHCKEAMAYYQAVLDKCKEIEMEHEYDDEENEE